MAEKKSKPAKGKAKAEQAEINIGMVGHVDHGKTSLVQALTGKWADTHSEELKRGISIRLGYADTRFYRCGACKGAEAYSPSEKCPNCGKKGEMVRKVSFVDAPGHETLMATMLSGAALMEGAVLVIAANEKCPQPRTEEHLMALGISGVKNIVVAQNKTDLVDKKAAIENQRQIKGFLKEYGYENATIIPTVANFGVNTDLLIEAIQEKIKTPKRESGKKLKMFVVRSFDVNKPGIKPEKLQGAVLGGSIAQGEIKKGQEIEISPGIGSGKLVTRCTGLSVSEGSLEKASAGGLIAVMTSLDAYLSRNDQMRGQVLGEKGSLPEPTKNLRLEVTGIKRLITGGNPEVKVNDMVVLTVGTMTAVGSISKKLKDKVFEIALKNEVIVEKDQRVAISTKQDSSWRLVAYGVAV